MPSFEHFRKDPFQAVPEIAEILSQGSLTVFLGAGISSGFGLPGWTSLIARVTRRDSDLAYTDSLKNLSDRDLAKLVDPIDTADEQFTAKLHEALYRDVRKDIVEQLVRSPLLLAVSALTTGTRRGRVSTIFTYNYDDLLETYLRRLGLSVKTRYLPTHRTRWTDVEVNHVHGFIPQRPGATVDAHEIILSEKSYRERRVTIREGWSAAIHQALQRQIGLFVGLSGDDSSILDVVASARFVGPESYSGYWLMTRQAFIRNQEEILRLGMCPIELPIDAFPTFIFEVCSKAAPTN